MRRTAKVRRAFSPIYMSAILALLNRRGEPVDPTLVSTMLAASPHRAPEGEAIWQQGPIALAHQHFGYAPHVTAPCPHANDAGTIFITADARLDNRADLVAVLHPRRGFAAPNSELILLAYEKWGIAAPTHLLGDFAFALWDTRCQHLFAARDALGVRDLCYYVDAGHALVASEIQQILAHPTLVPRLNEGKVAAYLAFLWHEHAETFYEDIYYCPPAHSLLITATEVRCWRHWDADPQRRLRYARPEAYADHFHELLAEAVRCRLPAQGLVGVSLSGGIDSAAVTALAAPRLPRRLHAFSYVFDALPECDERAMIESVAARYDLPTTFINGDDKWPLADLPTWPLQRDFVMADPFVRLPLAVMQAAEQAGCRILLTGHYGDLLFAGSHYWLLDMLRDGRWGQIAGIFRHHRATINPRQDVWEYGLRPFLPWRVRYAYRRWRPRPLLPLNPALHPDLIRRAGLAARRDQILGEAAFPAPGQWPRYRHLTLSVIPQGIAAARQLYNRHNLEAIDPFLDRRLVEFALAIPADQLGRPHRSKWVLRQAMQSDLPALVRERTDKTSLAPLLDKGLLRREQSAVRAILSQPQIVRRQFVRADWLRRALAFGPDWPQNRAFLWLCLSLELWLRRFWPAPGANDNRSPITLEEH